MKLFEFGILCEPFTISACLLLLNDVNTVGDENASTLTSSRRAKKATSNERSSANVAIDGR